jgi:acyl carrier protein
VNPREAVAPEAIEDWIVDRIAKLLDADPSSLDPTVAFVATGLTSADAVALTGELADWLGIEIGPTAVWDHPTPEALAGALAEALRAGAASLSLP